MSDEEEKYEYQQISADDEDSDEEQQIKFIDMVVEKTLNEGLKKTDPLVNPLIEEDQKSSERTDDTDELDDRIVEEIPIEEMYDEEVKVGSSKSSYFIDNHYENIIFQERWKREGATKGGCFEEAKFKIDPDIQKILDEAKMKFSAWPNNCREYCIKKGIIDRSALHFAKLLFWRNFGLVEKADYLFDSKNEDALEVRELFYTLFEFENLSLKNMLLSIHIRVSAPRDAHK